LCVDLRVEEVVERPENERLADLLKTRDWCIMFTNHIKCQMWVSVFGDNVFVEFYFCWM